MKKKQNNLIFFVDGEKYNVPYQKPWKIYKGETRQQDEYLDNVNTNVENLNYVTLNTTSMCNLSCSYCFESQNQIQENNFSFENLDKLFTFLKKENFRKGNFRFFGGEPLLKINLIKKIINKFKENKLFNVKFNIFTNGTILNEDIVNLIIKNDIVVYISIDGCKKIHNKNRPYSNGKRSYSDVLNNAKKLKNNSVKVIIRTVIDVGQNEYTINDVINNLMNEGFDYVSLAFPWVQKDNNFAMNDKKLMEYKRQIKDMAEKYLYEVKNKNFTYIIPHPFSMFLKKLINKKNMLDSNTCKVGYEGLIFSTKGNIYPCHAFVGKKNYILGNINEGITNHKLYQKFYEYGANIIPKCKNCPIKYLCTQRCAADSLYFNNDIYKPNKFRCEISKQIVKYSFFIYYQLSKNMPFQKRILKYAINKDKMTWDSA